MNLNENDKYNLYLTNNEYCELEIKFDRQIKFPVPMECALMDLVIPKSLVLKELFEDLEVKCVFKFMYNQDMSKIKDHTLLNYMLVEENKNINDEIITTYKINYNVKNHWKNQLTKIISNFNDSIDTYILDRFPSVRIDENYQPTSSEPNLSTKAKNWIINKIDFKFNSKENKYYIKNGNFSIYTKDKTIPSGPKDPGPDDDVEREWLPFYKLRGVFYLEFNDKLKKLLGIKNYPIDKIFHSVRLVEDDPTIYQNLRTNIDPISTFSSDLPPISVNKGLNYLKVYCDIIENSYYNNKLENLLCILPTTINEKDEFMKFRMESKNFIPLKYNEIDSIKISIKDEEDNDLIFVKGKILANILIQPKSIL